MDKIIDLIRMLEKKKGVGVSKETNVKLEFKMKASITETQRALNRLMVILAYAPLFFESDVVVTEATSDYDKNPDWSNEVLNLGKKYEKE